MLRADEVVVPVAQLKLPFEPLVIIIRYLSFDELAHRAAYTHTSHEWTFVFMACEMTNFSD